MRLYRVLGIILYTILFGCFLVSNASAVTWEKTFDGSDSDYGYSVQHTTDGGFIIAGSNLIRADANGNVL